MISVGSSKSVTLSEFFFPVHDVEDHGAQNRQSDTRNSGGHNHFCLKLQKIYQQSCNSQGALH